MFNKDVDQCEIDMWEEPDDDIKLRMVNMDPDERIRFLDGLYEYGGNPPHRDILKHPIFGDRGFKIAFKHVCPECGTWLGKGPAKVYCHKSHEDDEIARVCMNKYCPFSCVFECDNQDHFYKKWRKNGKNEKWIEELWIKNVQDEKGRWGN